MKLDPINAASAVKSAAAAATVPWLETISVALFGVPISVWMACFAGALFSATFYPAEASVARPVAIGMNTLGAVYLTSLALGTVEWAAASPAGVGFLVASALLLLLKSSGDVLRRAPGDLWRRLLDRLFGRRDDAGDAGGGRP